MMNDATSLKELTSITAIIGSVVNLKRAGAEWTGCCPFHHDTKPSFSVNEEKGLYYCHGCEATGDVYDFVMAHERVRFPEAKAIVQSATGLLPHGLPLPSKPAKGSAGGNSLKDVLAIWQQCDPISNSVAALYLHRRGIDLSQLPYLPAIRSSTLWNRETQGRHPGLVAGLTDMNGSVTGIQRTFLTPDGSKLDVQDQKRSLGSIKGSAIKLGDDSETLIVCEGLEDALSIKLEDPSRTVWATAGAGMMAGLAIPQHVSSVIIARDNDAKGRESAAIAAEAFCRYGKTVSIISPPDCYKDWNEQLQNRIAA